MRRKGTRTTHGIPTPVLSAGSPFRHGRLLVIPVVRTVRWETSPAYTASGEPLGLLLVEEGAGEMRIVPFTDTSSWWADFCSAYPAFAGVVRQTTAGDDRGATPPD